MSVLTPTEEQASIIEVAKGSAPLMIEAYAGTAKTSTLVMAAPRVREPALALAFNKRIAEEFKGRLPANWRVSTLNGLGYLAWARGLPAKVSLEVDDRKLTRLLRQLGKEQKVSLSRDQADQTRQLVSKAMLLGLSPGDQGAPLVPDEPETWAQLAQEVGLAKEDESLLLELARDTLIADIALAREGIISFDDQIYCPTIISPERGWPKWPALAVDEAQDLSQLNHRMIQLASRANGKLIAVGDSRQAIYAWRGADSASMSSLRELREGWEDRQLTLTFRCPKVVVQRQQGHAPGFRAAPSNREGLFSRFDSPSFEPLSDELSGGWTFDQLRRLAGPKASLAVLCRNNAPLLKLAFQLIRQRIGPAFAGRDIGKGLGQLLRKVAPPAAAADQIRGRLEEWKANEILAAEAADKPERGEAAADRADCLLAVLEGCQARDSEELQRGLDLVFSREGGEVMLSSIHRAKGLEWDTVVHLDPWRIPSKAARRAGGAALEQEANLRYVCETRTRDKLIEANLEDFR